MVSKLLIYLVLFLPQLLFSQVRESIELRDGWKFQKGESESAFQRDFNDADWESVTVPHDWAIYGPFDKEVDKQTVAIRQNNERVASEKTGRTGALPYIGEAWYRKDFSIANLDENKKVLLLFEGAMSQPKVFVNGEKVGEWNYGYSYFYFDITEHVTGEGNNSLAVHLSNLGMSSRWYPGAGLYRKVTIIVKNKESIDQWGTFIHTPFISSELAKVKVLTKVSGENLTIITRIHDALGNEVGSNQSSTPYGNEFEQDIAVEYPQLWSPETPYLYTATSQLWEDDVLLDEISTRFGIREINYESGKGFSLNGEVRKFKGVCLHHDLGPLGSAVNTSALRRQLQILKDMGADAVRSSHNMPSLEQLELCDEMGIMFLAESFDEWARPKVKNGYHLYFDTDAEKDVVNLVRATR
ncbi:MAG: hypothetical protein MUO54_13320, partial [Anaerolineales bacterium]|nr:hypothetical protein [Anaerolineales bacterium]